MMYKRISSGSCSVEKVENSKCLRCKRLLKNRDYSKCERCRELYKQMIERIKHDK